MDNAALNLREIDRLCAEKVMEWVTVVDEALYWWTREPKPPVVLRESWRPTTDPACSKLLRDKLAEKFTWILCSPGTECPEHFYFRLTAKGCAIKGYEAEAETAELATALCALRSVGETGEWGGK